MSVHVCPDLEVLCSCGVVGVILWDRTLGKYVSPTPGWAYHSDTSDDVTRDDSRLWHCGEPGHYQANLRLLRREGKQP